ncbi:MAG: hypothetical protein FWF77_00590, partial [Defluviitaleaceae bacterium]|nr:hypothetical protein [Defluviitaleaceae bacterium]
ATTADVIDPMTQSEISIPVLAAGESRTVSFGFAATEDAATRTYNVRFTVTYGAGDAARTFNQVAPLAVYNPDGDDDLPNLEFRQMTAPTGRINVGQTGLVSFYLFNSGEEEARNVRVTAAPASDSIVPTTQSTVVIPELAPGESHPISFGFRPTRTAATQTHDIQFTATYGTGDAARSFSQFAAFNVYNPDVEDDDDRRQIPRIIIHDSIVYPAVPRAGQEFDLTITFRNTNATQGVNNIRILMEEVRAQNLPGGQQTQEHIAGFTPVGSNTLFIDRLGPQSEVTKVLRFISSADGTPGMHNMRFTFDFQDDNFHEHESAEQISLQLAQVMRLELTEVNVGESVTAGGSVWFSFRVINSGRVNLLSTRVRAEGPEDVTEAGGEEGMFIGTINAQRWSNFEGRFDAPHDPGEHQFEFVITAEDNTGEPIELRHPFTLFVEDGMGFDFGDDMFMGDDFFHGGALPFPDDGMFFPDDGMFFEEANESGAFFSLVRGIFMRPVEPEGWDETFMGPFSPESAEMFGVDADHRVRLWVIIAPIVVILLAVAIPLLVIRNKRRRRLLFEDDED